MTPPHFSPDGRWWWDGARWQPAAGRDRRRSAKWILLAVAAVIAVVGTLLLIAAVAGPVGEQHDSDELGEDYCAYFPDDC